MNKIIDEWVRSQDASVLIGLGKKHRFAVAEVMDDVQICQ